MARIVVIGGGLIGLATAMMTARQGHHVTVLERDPAPPPLAPGAAWDRWERNGVPQFRQPHFLLPAGFRVLAAELPEVVARLRAAGADVHRAPDLAGGPPKVTLTARRPVLEYAVAAAAADRVDIRRGARATGLLFARRGLVQVTGVALADRTELPADLVIDAMGRVSPLPIWLTHIGAGEVTERAQPSGLACYSRYFRAEPGPRPGRLPGRPPGRRPEYGLTRCDGYSILVTPADAGAWSVTVCGQAGDPALRPLRSERNWARFLAACPALAPPADGEPIGGVLTAGPLPDRVRGLVRHGAPAATGILTVGDAWACTSPALGRGLTLGLMHAAVVAESVADHVKDPLKLALECDGLTRERILPWYRDTVTQASKHAAQLSAGPLPASCHPS